MLFWLFIILLIIGIILHNVFEFEFLGIFGDIIVVLSGLAVIISLFIIVAEYTTINPYLEKNREHYKAIIYKIESDACHDEFGLLNKEVLDEIQDWNSDLRFYQSIQRDFWVGIYFPNVYDEFEIIDYESFSK